MDSNTLTVISVLGAFIISAGTIVSNILISYFGKKADRKRELQIKIMDLAFKEYELKTKMTLEAAKHSSTPYKIYPFDYFLVFYSRLSMLVEKDKLNEEEITKVLHEIRKLADIYENTQ